MTYTRTRLTALFRDRAYRRSYVESFLKNRIAAQIRAIREARGMSQEQLAEKIGTVQSGVSKLENVNYSGWSLKTLRRLARAFDVALQVRFVTYGEVLADIEGFSKGSLLKVPFKEDPVFFVPGEQRRTVSVEAHAGSVMSAAAPQPRPEILDLMEALKASLSGKGTTAASTEAQVKAANDNLALAS